ncbi:YdcF family protein [Novosphingobium sp. B-7]|uniref:YdcF family protein n=1 Tax=Novosphingobium sp. B-7 TaxID=1298855 RepID=UPI0003B6E068|nr:YdcF family protein [Novosphingobium sp. B-7]
MRKPPGLFRRLGSALILLWVLGFLWFAWFLPQPAPDGTRTDGIVVLTGGGGRIPRALAMLQAGKAQTLLVSGVDRQVRPAEFAAEYKVDPARLDCCITLGFDSVDTRSNAHEAAAWIARHKIHSVRLVTTDWHMRRATFDLWVVAPKGLVIVRDAVPSRPSLKILFLEYNKLLARMVAWLAGW